MNRKKITLNEELSRMRHLLNVKSGQKMTITEINRTYIMEQKDSSAEQFLENKNGSWVYKATQGKTYYMDQGQPLVVQWNNQPTNRESFIPTITQGTSPGQTTDINQELFRQVKNAATAQRDSGVTTPLTQNGQKLTPEVDDIIGKAYYRMVRQPLLTTLEQQFNLPPETQRGDDFDWNTYFITLENASRQSPNNIQTLITALQTFQNGLKRFKKFLAESLTTTGLATQSTPKEQRVPVIGWATYSTNLENIRTLGVGAEEGLRSVINDSIFIEVEFLLPAVGQQNKTIPSMKPDEVKMAIRNMETAFYDFIGQNRRMPNSQFGINSNLPIILPTTNDILNHSVNGNTPKNALYDAASPNPTGNIKFAPGDQTAKINYILNNIRTTIRGSIKALLPDNITLP